MCECAGVMCVCAGGHVCVSVQGSCVCVCVQGVMCE